MLQLAAVVIASSVLAFGCTKSREEKAFGKAKEDIARVTMKNYAEAAYPQWAAAHASKECPAALAELSEYMNSRDTNDPWGNPYRLLCGATAPAGVKGVGVASSGADGKENTADDLRSWE